LALDRTDQYKKTLEFIEFTGQLQNKLIALYDEIVLLQQRVAVLEEIAAREPKRKDAE